AWQLAAVGLLALGFGAVRFGPPRAGLERRRRSPLEHVRALATALAAAGGHDVAVGALVRGLRRRLAPAASPGGGDWSAWVEQLSRTAPNPQAREAAGGLAALARPGRSAADVSRAAHPVAEPCEAARGAVPSRPSAMPARP